MVDIRSALPMNPLVRRIPEGRYSSIQEAERARMEAEKEQNKEPLLSLASHVKTQWQAAYNAKVTKIQDVLLQCARQRNGDYDPDVLADLRKEGDTNPIFMHLTNIKCRAAESWLRSVELPPGEKPWSIERTPIPELPPELKVSISRQIQVELVQFIMANGYNALTPDMVEKRMKDIEKQILAMEKQAADEDAARLEQIIHDQLVEGSYYKAFNDFLSDVVTFPAGFLKGPVVRKKPVIVWEGNNGDSRPVPGSVFKRVYYNPSPFDMFPSPGAKHIQDGYLFERIKLRRQDLEGCIGVEGFSEEAINGVLNQYGTGGLRQWLSGDQERAEVESRDHEQDDPDPAMDALEYWGSVQGKKLLEWGMKAPKLINVNANYNITAWLIGNWIVMVRLNPHPLGLRPYHSTCYEKINNTIWGKSVTMLMRDIQKICNAIARAMVRNLGIASGPQGEVSVDRVMPGEDIENLYPWKIWRTKDPRGTGRPAVSFYQPNALTDMLMRVYDYFFKQASEQTGIPQYIYGSENMGSSGAGSTASGLSMLMNAATKTMQDVIFQIDSDVTSPSIKEHWLHVMLFDEKVKKKGDINIIARASEHLLMQEQLQVRLIETLRETNNPADLQIMGLTGRAVLLREAIKKLKIPIENIVPDKDTMEQKEIALAQQMAQLQGPMDSEAIATMDAGGTKAGGELVRVNK